MMYITPSTTVFPTDDRVSAETPQLSCHLVLILLVTCVALNANQANNCMDYRVRDAGEVVSFLQGTKLRLIELHSSDLIASLFVAISAVPMPSEGRDFQPDLFRPRCLFPEPSGDVIADVTPARTKGFCFSLPMREESPG